MAPAPGGPKSLRSKAGEREHAVHDQHRDHPREDKSRRECHAGPAHAPTAAALCEGGRIAGGERPIAPGARRPTLNKAHECWVTPMSGTRHTTSRRRLSRSRGRSQPKRRLRVVTLGLKWRGLPQPRRPAQPAVASSVGFVGNGCHAVIRRTPCASGPACPSNSRSTTRISGNA